MEHLPHLKFCLWASLVPLHPPPIRLLLPLRQPQQASSGSTTTSITTTSSTTSESSGAAPAGHDGAPAASPPEDVSTKGGEPAIATIVEPVVAVEVEPDRPEDEANVDATKNEAESEDGKTNLHDDHGAQHDEHPVTETEQDKLQTNKQIWAN